jgi:flagellar biogenesis protein FliO
MGVASRHSPSRVSRLGWLAAAWLTAQCAAATALAEEADDMRYAPVAAEAAGPAVAPLILYRRDGQATESQNPESMPAGAAGQQPAASAGAGKPLRAAPLAAEPPTAEPPSAAAESAVPSPASGSPYNIAPPTNAANASRPALPLPAPPEDSPPRYDDAVELALHTADPPTSAEPATSAAPSGNVHGPAATSKTAAAADQLGARQLAPRTEIKESTASRAPLHEKSSASPLSLSRFESLSTAGAGLALVVGLFLVCMWLLRRGGGKPAGVLPSEAFSVLGRAPLTAQSFAHLLRIGNKLVLVAISPDGAQPLTEVVDPLEVDRLTGLCASGRGLGPTAEFQQVLSQLAREPARGFLGGEATGGRRSA